MAIFLVAKLVMLLFNMMFKGMQTPPEGGLKMFIGSFMGHLVFGIVVVLFISEEIKDKK